MEPAEAEFRDVLSRCVDIALQYWKSAQEPPTLPPGNAFGNLNLEEAGLGVCGAIDQFTRKVMPYLVHSIGSRYFGFVVGGITPASLVGDWLASAVDQIPNPYDNSISTQLTDQTIHYLLDLFGLPRGRFDGTFTSGTSVANLIALNSARQWCGENVGIDATEEGSRSLPEIAVFAVAPHISVVKALGILGMGRRAWRAVPSLPGREAIDPQALDRMLTQAHGMQKIVVASAGTVSTGDFDDLVALGELCARHGAWLHVDGAFGLFARCCASKAALLAGLENADSIAVDMHKWLNVPYDSGLLLCRHIRLVERTHRTSASYFFDVASELPDYSERGIQLSMRFRALPVWMALVAYGRAGVEAMISKNCAFAEELGQWLEASGKFELLAPIRLNVVLFRGKYSPAEQDARNASLIEAVNRSGKLYCSPGKVQGNRGIRLAICNWRTDASDLAAVQEALTWAYDDLITS